MHTVPACSNSFANFGLGFGLRVLGFGFRVHGIGFWVLGVQPLPDMVAVKDADFSKVDAVFCCLPHGTTQVGMRIPNLNLNPNPDLERGPKFCVSLISL